MKQLPKRLLVITLFLALGSRICVAAEAARPNFLLIFTDDHGYGDVSAYRTSDVRTPNIDRIGTRTGRPRTKARPR